MTVMDLEISRGFLLKMLIESLVLARMKYAISVWRPALQKGQIQRLQQSH